MEKNLCAVLVMLMLAGCGVGRPAFKYSEKDEGRITYMPRRTGVDTLIVMGTVFSAKTMQARVFMYDDAGGRVQAIHTYPDRAVFSEAGDTVVYNQETRKILKNLSLERRTAHVKCCCDNCGR